MSEVPWEGITFESTKPCGPLIGNVEGKGHVRHEEEGLRFVYIPAVPRDVARRSALRHLIDTFFEGSTEKAVAALLGGEASKITPEELDRLRAMIDEAQHQSFLKPDIEEEPGAEEA